MKIIKGSAGEDYIGAASLLMAEDKVDFKLWVDGNGKLYVQLVKGSQSGKCSPLRFSASEYAGLRGGDTTIKMPSGFDENGQYKETTNTNDGRLLTAVLRHLLPKDEDG